MSSVPRRPLTTPLPPQVKRNYPPAVDGKPVPQVTQTPPSPPPEPIKEVGARPETLYQHARPTIAVQLPSKGRFYGGKMPDGEAEFLPLTAREDQILAGMDGTNTHKIFDMVLARTLRPAMENAPALSPADMLTVDRFYAMLILRANALGPEMKYPFNCVFCEQMSIVTSNVPYEFPMVEGTAKEEPFFCTLKDGSQIGLRLLRGKDDRAIEAYRNSLKKPDKPEDVEPGDPAYGYINARHLVSFEDADGKGYNFTPEQAQEWFMNLNMSDSRAIQNACAEASPGVINRVTVKCPKCEKETLTRIPLSAEYFFL